MPPTRDLPPNDGAKTMNEHLLIIREHAAFHLEILGDREEYCIVSKNYNDPTGKDVITYWKKKAEIADLAQKLNDEKRICWISLNDKEQDIDKIIGVKVLCVFFYRR